MKNEKRIEERIRRTIMFEKCTKREAYFSILFLALIVFIVVLMAAVICAIDDVKLPIWDYKSLFSLIIACILLGVFLMILSRTIKLSVSQKEIKRQAKFILERLLCLKQNGKQDASYTVFTREPFAVAPQDFDCVISDLKEILANQKFANNGLCVA